MCSSQESDCLSHGYLFTEAVTKLCGSEIDAFRKWTFTKIAAPTFIDVPGFIKEASPSIENLKMESIAIVSNRLVAIVDAIIVRAKDIGKENIVLSWSSFTLPMSL